MHRGIGSIRKTVSILTSLVLLLQTAGFAQVFSPSAVNADVPASRLSGCCRPMHLRWLAVDPDNRSFNVILDTGDATGISPRRLREESQKLIEYFLIGLVLPNSSFWVNLRPDAPLRVIDPLLERTDVGRILLEADVRLKKDLAAYTSPATAQGRRYWDALYKRAAELFGPAQITVSTASRPWIVPGEIIIGEGEQGAYVYKATLDVRLEDDWIGRSDPVLKQLNAYGAQLLKREILPGLIKEVNTSEKYAALRQVYYSLILAQWFKLHPAQAGASLSAIVDAADPVGLASSIPWSKNTFTAEYRRSLQAGEYNQKEYVPTSAGLSLRQYASGGALFNGSSRVLSVSPGLGRAVLHAPAPYRQALEVPFPQAVRVVLSRRSNVDTHADEPDGGTQAQEEIRIMALYGGLQRLTNFVLKESRPSAARLLPDIARSGHAQMVAAVVPELMRAAASSNRPDIRAAANECLAAVRSPAQTAALEPVAPESSLQPAAVSAVDRENLAGFLHAMGGRDINAAIAACAAMRALFKEKPGLWADRQVVEAVGPVLKSSFPRARLALMEAVEQSISAPVSDELLFLVLKGMNDRDDQVSERALFAFARILAAEPRPGHTGEALARIMDEPESFAIAGLVFDLIARKGAGELEPLWQLHAGNRAHLRRALEQNLADAAFPGLYTLNDVSWRGLAEQLIEYNRLTADADAPLRSVIVKMLLAREGAVSFGRMKWLVAESLSYFHVNLAHALEKTRSVALRRQLIKASGVSTADSIEVLRTRAIRFAAIADNDTSFDSSRGVAGRIRSDIHLRLSPQDLRAVRAYRTFLDGDASELTALGYTISESDRVPPERKARVAAAAEDLLDALEEIFGEESGKGVRAYFALAKKMFRDHPVLANEIQEILDFSGKKDLAYLERINAARSLLAEVGRTMRSTELMMSIGLDNALENLYYGGVAAFEPSVDYADDLQTLKVVRSLMEAVRLNGYCREEIAMIVLQVEAVLARGIRNQEDRLEIYALYRRLERMIKGISQETINDYQEIAQRLGAAAGKADAPWVGEFSAQLMRRDVVYWLASVTEKAMQSAMSSAGISGWQVIQEGVARGRIKVIVDNEDFAGLKDDEIAVAAQLPDDSRFLIHARGIITTGVECLLSHPAVRARQQKTVFVSAPSLDEAKKYAGQWVELSAQGEQVIIRPQAEAEAQREASIVPKKKPAGAIAPVEPDRAWSAAVVLPSDYTPQRVGNKAYTLSRIPDNLIAGQRTARHFSLSFAFFDAVLALEINRARKQELQVLQQRVIQAARDQDVREDLRRMRALVEELELPQQTLGEIVATATELFGRETPLFLRSSTNAEDLADYSGAGVYDSFGAVTLSPPDIARHVKKVWASVWNEKAFFDRQANAIDHAAVRPAVLIQEMLNPEYSFVIHTRSPVNGNDGAVLIEAVQGFGETLVSGLDAYAGQAYRFSVDKSTGELKLISFANKSRKIVVRAGRFNDAAADYHDDWLVTPEGRQLLQRIGMAAIKLADAAGAAQDIEGVIVNDRDGRTVGFVQTRAQVMLNADGGNLLGGVDLRLLSADNAAAAGAQIPRARGIFLERSAAECDGICRALLAGLERDPSSLEGLREYVVEMGVRADAEQRLKDVSIWLMNRLRMEEAAVMKTPAPLREALVCLGAR
ncbi:MAG TPA: PEP/pyruvate-binding domain-containing protein [Candidatus Omnitrophota bacterium]|nr:PEP/pyruvate-binding domain-containing protein [Candidatus Omnitrophota bacterium]